MTESRMKKTTYNMFVGFLYQFIAMILNFVSRTVFIHTLGTEYLGLNGIFSDVLGLLAMADLGFNTAMSYSFYKPLAENDEKKITALVSFYRKVYHIIALVVTLVGLAIIPFLRLIVKTEREIPQLERYYLFALAGIVVSYLFVYKTTILTADQKNYQVTQIRLWTSLVKTCLQICVLWFFHNYIAYLAINMLMEFLNNLIASRKSQKSYPYIGNREQLAREEQKSIFDNMKSVFIYKVSSTLFSATDNILISVIVGTAAVGVYSNYLMVSNKLLLIIQIIFSAVTASVGNVVAKEKAEKKYEVFCAMQSVSFILCGIITSVFFLMANDFVYVWLGKTYTLSSVTIAAMTLNTYLACVLQPLWAYRDATGLYKRTKYVMLVGAGLNIVLSVIWGQKWGIVGIVFASAVARLSTYFWYEPKLLFREYFEQGLAKYYLSFFANFALVAGVGLTLSWLLKDFEVNDWFALIMKGILISIICSVVFLTVYCRTVGFRIIGDKVKQIVGRR